MQLKTGRRLRLIACLVGILGGLGQAMLALGIHSRTESSIDAFAAAAMAVSNFAVCLVLIGHHSVHIYTSIKSSIAGLFVAGVLCNLVGVTGLLLNENVLYGAGMAEHLLFKSSHKQDYAFAALFYISVSLSCVFVAGLATYFLIDVSNRIRYEMPSEMATSIRPADEEAPNDPTENESAISSPPEDDHDKLPARLTRRTNQLDLVYSQSSDVSHVDGTSFCSARSEQDDKTLSGESTDDSTLVDEQEKQQDEFVTIPDSPQGRPLSVNLQADTAETSTLFASPTRYYTIERQELGRPKSSTRSGRSSNDHNVGANAETALGRPLYTSTPLRSSSPLIENEDRVPLPPPPPPTPPPLPAKLHIHHTGADGHSSKSGSKGFKHKDQIQFRHVPGSSQLSLPNKPKRTVSARPPEDTSSSASFRGLPNSLLTEVQSFDRSRFTRSPRRPSCAKMDENLAKLQSSNDTADHLRSSSTITTDHSTQTSVTSKSQSQMKHV